MFTVWSRQRLTSHPLRMECGQRLLERLDGLRLTPQHILDLDSAPAAGARQLAERFVNAQVTAMEAREAQLKWLKRERGWWPRRYAMHQGSLLTLAETAHQFDLIHAPLVMPRHREVEQVLRTLRQALTPGGLLLISVLGPDTLNGQVGGGDAQRLGSALTRAGFLEPVLDTDWITVHHPDEADLAQCMGDMGVNANAHPAPETPCSLVWEVVQATAWAAEDGMPVRTDHGEEASMSIDRISVRQRNDT